jgi:DNA-binding NarL/FixJ family response regulator
MKQLTLPTSGDSGSPLDSTANQYLSSAAIDNPEIIWSIALLNKVLQLTLPTSGDSGSPLDSTVNQHLSSFSACESLTIAFIDSRPLTREAITRLLNRVGSLKTIPLSRCSELLEKGPVLSEVEIVLLNIGSAAIDNPEIVGNIALLNKVLPNTSIMVICDHEERHQIGKALREGIRGYIPTTLTWQILIGALRLVQAGGTFIPPCVLTELPSQQPIAPEAAKVEVMAPDLFGLTRRQREVLNLLRQGRQNKMIAHELNMRESTVKVHVRHIMRKMRVHNRTEATALLAREMRNEDGFTRG